MKNTITIGIDLGDKFHIAVVFDGEGNELETAKVTNTKVGVRKFFQPYKNARVQGGHESRDSLSMDKPLAHRNEFNRICRESP